MQPTIQNVAVLPSPRGPLSEAVVTALRADPGDPPSLPAEAGDADAHGDDLQLALQLCYELHYQGFDGVCPSWEWHPELLRTRRALEARFLDGLRDDIGEAASTADVQSALDSLLVHPSDGGGPAHQLREQGTWPHMREYLALRSIYHHKEADPHAFVIPRLHGQAKAALVAVEFDEYGGGRFDRMHSRLYAELLDGAGLNADYLHYLDDAPAPALAPVNLMSMLALHREQRGALVGHFAAAEISTAPSARVLAEALRRLGAEERCIHFYDEHVEADAVHEQVMRREVIGDLLEREPDLAGDVAFGIHATTAVESRLGDHVLNSWEAGEPATRRRLE